MPKNRTPGDASRRASPGGVGVAQENASAGRYRLRSTVGVLASLLAIKLFCLALDPSMRLFFGDSASYLHSALTGWIPPDRSFLYGLFIRYTALAAHSLFALALAQTALGAVAGFLLFLILRDVFRAPAAIAAVLALAFAIEPAQLFYERMVMAESAGMTSLACMIFAGMRYVHRPSWVWPMVWAGAGIITVAFRMSALPVVLGFSLLPVLAVAAGGLPRPPWPRLLLHAAVALIATLALHHGYKQLYGHLNETRPDYIADAGYFRLGLVAPLVTPEQVARVGLPPDLLEHVGPPLADPRSREAQIWQPDGLIARIRDSGVEQPERAARKLAGRAVQEHPLGLFRLALATISDYLDDSVVRARVEDDVGIRPADADLVQKLRLCCAYDASEFEQHRGPVARCFSASTTWLTVCYFGLFPLAMLMLATSWRRARAAALLLAATCSGMVLAQALFSHIVSFRYLHPFPFAVLLCTGASLAALVDGRGRRVAAVEGAQLPSTSSAQAG